MSLIRAAGRAEDGARGWVESAGSESLTSLGGLSTSSILRAIMEWRDPVAAGQFPASVNLEPRKPAARRLSKEEGRPGCSRRRAIGRGCPGGAWHNS
jgi:hypothetical protein